MDHVLSYYVFDPARGWLSFDEKTWTPHFEAANEFADHQLAKDIGARQSSDKETFYVMACNGRLRVIGKAQISSRVTWKD